MAVATTTSVQQAFERFESDTVRIPPAEDEAGQRVHPRIRLAVRQALGSLWLDDYLSGSYSRRVQVAPKLKDIDVVVMLADPTGLFRRSATSALRAIEAAALTCDLVRGAEIRCRSVRAYLHGYDFTVDLVAALESPQGTGVLLARRIPEEGLDDWSPGNPKGQCQAAVEKNAVCGGMYIPAVRIAKFWKNGACPEFKSYHAESIMFHSLSADSAFADAMVGFFDEAHDRLAPGVHTEDPGAPGTLVDERLEEHERAAARRAVDIARHHAHAAEAAATPEEALGHWARVFGPAFPAPQNSRDRVAGSLQARTAGVSGLGITANRGPQPVQPRSWRKAP